MRNAWIGSRSQTAGTGLNLASTDHSERRALPKLTCLGGQDGLSRFLRRLERARSFDERQEAGIDQMGESELHRTGTTSCPN